MYSIRDRDQFFVALFLCRNAEPNPLRTKNNSPPKEDSPVKKRSSIKRGRCIIESDESDEENVCADESKETGL